jgi:hypothetical protein
MCYTKLEQQLGLPYPLSSSDCTSCNLDRLCPVLPYSPSWLGSMLKHFANLPKSEACQLLIFAFNENISTSLLTVGQQLLLESRLSSFKSFPESMGTFTFVFCTLTPEGWAGGAQFPSAFFQERVTLYFTVTCKSPETIRTLMLVKQRLRLARGVIQDILGGLCKSYISFICPYTQFIYRNNVFNKYSNHTTVKRRKTAVCSRHRTVITLDFLSTAPLRYGPHPYSTVFCTAVAVHGTVVSPNKECN